MGSKWSRFSAFARRLLLPVPRGSYDFQQVRDAVEPQQSGAEALPGAHNAPPSQQHDATRSHANQRSSKAKVDQRLGAIPKVRAGEAVAQLALADSGGRTATYRADEQRAIEWHRQRQQQKAVTRIGYSNVDTTRTEHGFGCEREQKVSWGSDKLFFF